MIHKQDTAFVALIHFEWGELVLGNQFRVFVISSKDFLPALLQLDQHLGDIHQKGAIILIYSIRAAHCLLSSIEGILG